MQKGLDKIDEKDYIHNKTPTTQKCYSTSVFDVISDGSGDSVCCDCTLINVAVVLERYLRLLFLPKIKKSTTTKE
jgi:hypothetical protein